ncbi:MAG TPA: hypothetical protein VFY15_01750 [Acidimicrobiia bacterium]|nr:hypothetical protein [Acidimicrobiia bacterium]
MARVISLTVLVVTLTACGLPTAAGSCSPLAPTDVLYLDGTGFFQAAFDFVKCESTSITATDLVADGILAVLAPSPGFDEVGLVSFAQQHLEPLGLHPINVYYYILSEDRVGVAHIPVEGSLEESLASAEETYRRIHPPDEEPNSGTPVPYVLLLEVVSTDEDELTAALAALASSPYAFQIGDAATAPPPFDPARDRMVQERAEDL